MDKKALIALVRHAGNLSFKEGDFSVSGKNDLLILITAAGQITGTPLEDASTLDINQKVADTIFLAARNEFIESTSEDAFLLLKNATLKTANCDISYSYLYVFTDDIIAATIGSSNQN